MEELKALRPGFMRTSALLLATFCLLASVRAEPARRDPVELAAFMAGDYIIVGRKPDSKVTYSGRLTFRVERKKLVFVRIVDGHTVRGVAAFDTVAGGDLIPVLRLHFSQDGRSYEGIYQWASDYDNYVRFTGYVYSPGGKTKAAGLEAFFRHLPPSASEIWPLAPTPSDKYPSRA